MFKEICPQTFLSQLRTCDGKSVNRFSRTTKVICDQAFLPTKSQHVVSGYQGNIGQSTQHRLDRLQIVSQREVFETDRPRSFIVEGAQTSSKQADVYDFRRVRSLQNIHEKAIRPNIENTCGGPPYLYARVPEWYSSENLAGQR